MDRAVVRWGAVAAVLGLAGCSGDSTEPGNGGDSCVPSTASYQTELAQGGDVRDVHDPVMIKEGDTYYLFSTGHGVPVRQSTDMVQWRYTGQVFSQPVPPWAVGAIPGVEFPWAPDIAYFNERYHLYYSVSTFGSQRSAIGLATTPTLDPDDPEYEWVDHGSVVQSEPGLDYNAIDPNVVIDEDGTPWLSWGSFWGGIRMRRLNAETGKPSTEDATLYALAARPTQSAIEAPFIVYHDGYYYLFVSWDSCCQGASSTYKIVVGRSESVTGPYADRDGRLMMQGGGTLVLRGYGRVAGPGHQAVFSEDGHDFLVHHFYDANDDGVPKLQIRPLVWAEDGWPLSGYPYDGSWPGDVTQSDLAGTWGHSVDFARPVEIELTDAGTIEQCEQVGTWSLEGSTLTLRWEDENGSATRTDACVVSADGWYTCRTSGGVLVRGYSLD